MATFRGSEYLCYDLSQNPIQSSSDEITLSFKTWQRNGLILHTGKSADYVNLALKDGAVSLVINLGSGAFEAIVEPVNGKFNDNAWHDVKVTRNLRQVMLKERKCWGKLCSLMFGQRWIWGRNGDAWWDHQSFFFSSSYWCDDSGWLKNKAVNGNLSLLQYIHFHFINFLFFLVWFINKILCMALLSSLFFFSLFLFCFFLFYYFFNYNSILSVIFLLHLITVGIEYFSSNQCSYTRLLFLVLLVCLTIAMMS